MFHSFHFAIAFNALIHHSFCLYSTNQIIWPILKMNVTAANLSVLYKSVKHVDDALVHFENKVCCRNNSTF